MRPLRGALGIALATTVLAGCAGTRPDVAVGIPSSTAWAGTGTVLPSLGPPGPAVTELDVSASGGSEPVEPGREYDGVYDASAEGAAAIVLVVVDSGIISLRADCGGTWGSAQWAGGVLSYQPYVEPPPQTAPYTDHLGVTQTPEPPPPEPTLEERCGTETAGTMNAVQDVLGAAPVVTRTDTGLTLTAPDGRDAVLVSLAPADEPPVTGRHWELISYRPEGAASVDVPPEGAGWLELMGTALRGSTSCNGFYGRALATGSRFVVMSASVTEMGCVEGTYDTEEAVTMLIASPDGLGSPAYTVTDDILTLSSDEMELRYRDAGPARMTG